MPNTSSSRHERLRRATFWTLFVGYGAYYLCRANLGVASPLLQSELHLDKVQIGAISTASTFAYALGKFTLGPTADVLLGGKRVFLLGLAGAIVANVLFGASTGLWVFIVIWSLNRFVQSGGWMGLVQLVSGWYERSRYGVVMAWLSLSFLLGDAAARGLSALLLRLGLGWRALFFVPAGICAVFFLVASRTLATPPKGDREDEPRHSEEDAAGSASLREVFSTLLRNRGFWITCALSLLLTFLRTVFLDWTALYLVDSGATAWEASLQSMLFPLAGAAGTLFAGWYSDRVSKARRGPVAASMLGLLAPALVALPLVGARVPGGALALIAVAGFLLVGPYSLLAGCLALDFGGKRASATAAGIIDGFGYVGGAASGLGIGGIVQTRGWTVAFFLLAAASALAFLVALVFTRTAERGANPV